MHAVLRSVGGALRHGLSEAGGGWKQQEGAEKTAIERQGAQVKEDRGRKGEKGGDEESISRQKSDARERHGKSGE